MIPRGGAGTTTSGEAAATATATAAAGARARAYLGVTAAGSERPTATSPFETIGLGGTTGEIPVGPRGCAIVDVSATRTRTTRRMTRSPRRRLWNATL
jgi:hypothetical protein